jgi:hypothetical protein
MKTLFPECPCPGTRGSRLFAFFLFRVNNKAYV